MRFDRCDICGYVEDEGSSYTNQAPSNKVKVSWSSAHNEYQCTLCRAVISKTSEGYKIRSRKLYEDGEFK